MFLSVAVNQRFEHKDKPSTRIFFLKVGWGEKAKCFNLYKYDDEGCYRIRIR